MVVLHSGGWGTRVGGSSDRCRMYRHIINITTWMRQEERIDQVSECIVLMSDR